MNNNRGQIFRTFFFIFSYLKEFLFYFSISWLNSLDQGPQPLTHGQNPAHGLQYLWVTIGQNIVLWVCVL